MSSIKKNQKIYLICEGTSTNDIIKSINEYIPKKTASFFNFSSKDNKIEFEEFPKLEDIGVKELYMCQETNKDLIKESFIKSTKKLTIYTSLNYSNIESAFVLMSSFPDNTNHRDVEILPLPYMSNNTNIKNKKILDVFKKKFGKYSPLEEKTVVENYWEEKSLNSEFLIIKKFKTLINWKNIPQNLEQSGLNTYSFFNFKKIMELLCSNKHKDDADSVFIFICNPQLIVDILKLFKKIKYNRNIDIIERSSIWEINIELNVELNRSGSIIKKSAIYERFDKVYPTEYNHGTLKYNGTYSYNYNDNKFILFNALKFIPINYLVNIVFHRLSNDKRNAVKKILQNINKSSVSSNKKNNRKLLSYNKLIEEIN